MFSNISQALNASTPMLSTLSGIFMFINKVQYENAASSMIVIPSGSSTCVKA